MDNQNINYKPGVSKDDALKLLEAHGVDLTQPPDDFSWKVIEGRDENGNMHREFYPVSEPHETARKQAEGQTIDYDRIIEERTAEKEKADAVIDDQSKLIEALMQRMEEIESNSLPKEKMTPPQLKQLAKRRGIDVKGLKTKKELLAALEG